MSDTDTKSSSESSRSNESRSSDRASEAREGLSDKSRDALSGGDTATLERDAPSTAADRAAGQDRLAAEGTAAKNRVEQGLRAETGAVASPGQGDVVLAEAHGTPEVADPVPGATVAGATPEATELDGFGLRYGDADRAQVQAQAQTEMEVLAPGLSDLASRHETLNPLEQDTLRAMEGRYRDAAKRYELAAETPGALRESGLLDQVPSFAAERVLAEAEAHRLGADDVAAGVAAASFEGRPALEAVRELQAAAPAEMGRLLETTFDMAGLEHLSSDISGRMRTQLGREYGARHSEARRALDAALPTGQSPFAQGMGDVRSLVDDLADITAEGVSTADRRAVQYGMTYNVGRTFYGANLSILSGAAAGLLISSPIRITRSMLDTNGNFLSQRNAGLHTPTFSRWLDPDRVPGGTVEILPSGTVRYGARIDAPGTPYHGQRITVDYTDGVPDFSGYGVARVDIPSPVGRRSGGDPNADLRAATEMLRSEIAAGRVDRGRFTAGQLADIEAGLPQIRGLTWHHDGLALNANGTGPMRLVDAEIHGLFGHQGWASTIGR